MPRAARIVIPGIPHHITQRGNRRQDVFFKDENRETYLGWLSSYCAAQKIEILTYCLMTNHIHLVAIPQTQDGLWRALGPLQTRYAQALNRLYGWSGHIWQGRYFSSPLDELHMWAAIRYVERNPVRAGLVAKAEDYRWSGAAAHCGLREDPVLTRNPLLLEMIEAGPLDWSGWLAESEDEEKLSLLRQNVQRGLPCGSKRFVSKLEKRTGRTLRFRPAHRPKKGDCPT